MCRSELLRFSSASISSNLDSNLSNEKKFIVWDLKFNVEAETLVKDKYDSDILKCIKGVINENNNVISYNELSEVVDSNCIIGNNFWSEENFLKACKFEYRDYLDFSTCKILYE